jgi:pimeloyl-ACP methyl ester carboxylesterase
MKRALANGIDIAYETFGDRHDPALVLVMGLGTQMLGWPAEFCAQLAAQGFFVVRFDNRDIGESTHLESLPVPDPIRVALRRRRPPYTIEDMATDTLALLDALGLDRVHLMGASMGGFIAQTVAIKAPGRILSLTLMMTSTGSRRHGYTSPKVMATILRRKPAADRSEALDASVAMYKLVGSVGYPADESVVREFSGQSYDRAYDPAGAQRQLAAVAAQPNRTAALRELRMPTLVMHGLSDSLVNVSGGIALARTIPGALFVGFHGMGHDLPPALWPEFITQILSVTRRASGVADARGAEQEVS